MIYPKPYSMYLRGTIGQLFWVWVLEGFHDLKVSEVLAFEGLQVCGLLGLSWDN